jgi:hypothetical protein
MHRPHYNLENYSFLAQISPNWVDGDWIRFPKRSVLKDTQDGILDEDKMMDNVQKRNIYTNVPSSQTFRPYLGSSSNIKYQSFN